jgi:serine phosphatase RsbU (regulator of sigma subunit)
MNWINSIKVKVFFVVSAIVTLSIVSVSYQNATSLTQSITHQQKSQALQKVQMRAQNVSFLVREQISLLKEAVESLHKPKNSAEGELQKIEKRDAVELSQSFSRTWLCSAQVIDLKAKSFEKNFHWVGDLPQSLCRFRSDPDLVREMGKKWARSNKISNSALIWPVDLGKENGLVGMALPVHRSNNIVIVFTLQADFLHSTISSDGDGAEFILNDSLNILVKPKNFDASNLSILKHEWKNLIKLANEGSITAHETRNNGDHSAVLHTLVGKIQDTNLFYVKQTQLKSERSQLKRFLTSIFAWGIFILLLSLGAAAFATKSMTFRIFKILDVTKSISKGHLDARIQGCVDNDELGVLARAVNEMGGNLTNLMRVRELALRQHSELKMAEAVQRSLFPSNIIRTESSVMLSWFRPATECAGDWWGLFELDSETQVFVIADATGHGAHSAIVSAIAYSFFVSMKENWQHLKPNFSMESQLETLGRILYSSGQGNSTMTLLAMTANLEKKTLQFVNAAHCFPLVGDPDRGFAPVTCSGNPLGAEPTPHFESKTVTFRAGTRVFMYTDGLIENQTARGKLISKRVLKQALNDGFQVPLLTWFDCFRTDLEIEFEGNQLSDDITVLIAEFDERVT